MLPHGIQGDQKGHHHKVTKCEAVLEDYAYVIHSCAYTWLHGRRSSVSHGLKFSGCWQTAREGEA
jgi:hypothetical protein